MTPFKKRFLWWLIPVVILNLGVAFWVYVHDLQRRYPDANFSKAQLGWASWYSEKDRFINKKTANGETFDDTQMTCASWDYPFGEKLLIINTLNGKSVVCRVNDRGPAKRLKREVDLTQAAFKKIGKLKRGLIYATVIPASGNKKSK